LVHDIIRDDLMGVNTGEYYLWFVKMMKYNEIGCIKKWVTTIKIKNKKNYYHLKNNKGSD